MAALDPQEHIAKLERELAWAKLKIQSLEERWRRHLIEKYGPKSETLSDLQLKLLDEEPGVTREEIEAEAHRDPLPAKTPRERKPHPGRKPLPDTLPRMEETMACADPHCSTCGGETKVIGYDASEVLDREPARWFVRVTKREKRACETCSSVRMPELVPRIVEKGLASDRVVIDTVIAKYVDHLPLYRQEAILQREAGVEIGRATLDGWVMRVGEMLMPIVEAMRAELLGASYLQADETTVPVQMHDKRGADHQAYLWQYGTPGGSTVFDFQLGRGREGPKKWLGKWAGILQTDGYIAYDGVGGEGLLHVGCWAHARRKFVDAVKVNAEDAASIAMVTRMDALFCVDRDARKRQLSPADRHAQRQEHALPWLDEIHAECLKLKGTVLPKSATGQAVAYTLTQWEKLRRLFDHGTVELSNNIAENSMRPVALGRKNWLHVGSAQAGPKVAAILSVVESCRRLGVPLRDYLLAVLPGLDRRKVSEVAALTPSGWFASCG